jgi:hypothetical protein
MGTMTTAKNYIAFFNKHKQQLVSKHRGRLLNGIIFLQRNASLHKAAIMHQKLADLHSEVLKHLAYMPDLASLDGYLFPSIKKHFKG